MYWPRTNSRNACWLESKRALISVRAAVARSSRVSGARARRRRRRRRPVTGRVRRPRAPLDRLGFERLAVPLRIAEVAVRLHEVQDREVVLAVVQPRAAPDDLFELDDRADGPHEHDV